MTSSPSPLLLPLAALFVAFFVAPLIVLVALSVSVDTAGTSLIAANYLKFFTDRFNYSILWDTLLLGVKATLVCLVFGYPIAWICARASALAERARLPRHPAHSHQRGGAHVRMDRDPRPPGRAAPDCALAPLRGRAAA